ncbi:MAG: NADP-dependent malic enzyme [Candidatus Izemoplasmatales bacterium]|nr:NADP-dependent malic enzyme [Candidatus Izemoplasmatales bacterium]MDY0138240.1 NADP-dependent malic enzyme [Candidatus Izemoplasmatales bacterium]
MNDFKDRVLKLHKINKGKLNIIPNISLDTKNDLSLAYTPGVAYPCLEIARDKSLAYDYTMKGKTVAIITDGSAVLGLGKIGAEASIPVMEGKSALLYKFSQIQAVPISLDTFNEEEIIKTVKLLAPNYSAIMLEDISAPKCVYIEQTLQKDLDIPVFHDDQHGTAIVVSAALINALKVVNKSIDKIKIVVSGSGAAGSAIIKLLNLLGAKDIYNYNILGVVNKSKYEKYDEVVKNLIDDELINSNINIESLSELMVDKDVFIGVSAKNILNEEMINSMNKNSIVFALANPDPEISPEDAKNGGARIIGTGRSDYPNQINNVLVFPGLMKGVLKARAKAITNEIKVVACKALANLVTVEELSENFILPDIFDSRVVDTVADAVYQEIKKG